MTMHRTTRTTSRRLSRLALPLAVATAGAAWAADAPVGENRPAGHAIEMTSGGLSAWLVDERDAGLRRALEMLDERVLELPGEMNEDPAGAKAVAWVLGLMNTPGRLTVDIDDDFSFEADGPPFRAQLDLHATDKAGAERLAGQVAGMLANAGAPPAHASEQHAGLSMMDLDGVRFHFGAHGRQFSASLNGFESRPFGHVAELPRGVAPAFSCAVDFPAMAPVFDEILAQAGPDAGFVRRQMEIYNLIGPDASRITVALGHGSDRMVGRMTYTGYGDLLEAIGAKPDRWLNASDFRPIPADAGWVKVSRFDPGAVIDSMRMMSEEIGQDPVEMIHDMVGVHLERDLIDALGQTMGTYLSTRTGGGGFGSMVLFAEVADEARLNQTMARLTGMANQMAQGPARGYVRFQERTIDGETFVSLVFPGVPIPLEVSMAVRDGWWMLALSPQSLIAALEQLDATRNITHNDAFAGAIGEQYDGAMQVQYVDTARYVERGYATTSLLMAALANMTRSPRGERDAGLVMPSLPDLLDGCRPGASIVRVDDAGDLTMTFEGDRSIVANMTAGVGAMGGYGGLVAAGLAAGAVLPAMGQARANATSMKNMAQMRQLAIAAAMYSAEHNDRYPGSIDAFLEHDMLEASVTRSVYPPHHPYVLRPDELRMASIRYPDRAVMAYDETPDGDVAVVFFDGHVELVSAWDFGDLVDHEANAWLRADR